MRVYHRRSSVWKVAVASALLAVVHIGGGCVHADSSVEHRFLQAKPLTIAQPADNAGTQRGSMIDGQPDTAPRPETAIDDANESADARTNFDALDDEADPQPDVLVQGPGDASAPQPDVLVQAPAGKPAQAVHPRDNLPPPVHPAIDIDGNPEAVPGRNQAENIAVSPSSAGDNKAVSQPTGQTPGTGVDVVPSSGQGDDSSWLDDGSFLDDDFTGSFAEDILDDDDMSLDGTGQQVPGQQVPGGVAPTTPGQPGKNGGPAINNQAAAAAGRPIAPAPPVNPNSAPKPGQGATTDQGFEEDEGAVPVQGGDGDEDPPVNAPFPNPSSMSFTAGQDDSEDGGEVPNQRGDDDDDPPVNAPVPNPSSMSFTAGQDDSDSDDEHATTGIRDRSFDHDAQFLDGVGTPKELLDGSGFDNEEERDAAGPAPPPSATGDYAPVSSETVSLPKAIVIDKAVTGNVHFNLERKKADARALLLHFKTLSLLDGDKIVLTSNKGDTEVLMRSAGNAGGIWTRQLAGSAVKIEFFPSTEQQDRSKNFHVELDAYRFLKDAAPSDTQHSVCGATTSFPAKCFLSGRDVDERMYVKAQAVARVLVDGSIPCTGALLGKSGEYFLTAAQCLPTEDSAKTVRIEFGAESPSCEDKCAKELSCLGSDVVTGSQVHVINRELGYAVLKLAAANPQNLVLKFGYVTLRGADEVALGEQLYIPHHPSAFAKRIATENDNGNIKAKALTSAPRCGPRAADDHVAYEPVDMAAGSSGAPVLAASDHRVVAMHLCGGCAKGELNSGLAAPAIHKDLQAKKKMQPEFVQ